MKDRIIARLTYYKDIDEESSANPNKPMIDKIVHGEKVKVWDQAIAIIRELMKDDQ